MEFSRIFLGLYFGYSKYTIIETNYIVLHFYNLFKLYFTFDHFIRHKIEVADAIIVVVSFILDLVFLDDDNAGGLVGKFEKKNLLQSISKSLKIGKNGKRGAILKFLQFP